MKGSNSFSPTLDWSPDGKFLAITESHENKTHSLIALLSLADLSMRPLTSPSGQELDYGPAFSPDGSTVAFVRSIVAGMVSDLYVIPNSRWRTEASDVRSSNDLRTAELDTGRA